MTDQFNREYAYYKVKFAERQAENDAFNDDFGFPRVDLAHAEATKRAKARAMPRYTWAEQQERFKQSLAADRYRKAVGI